jgi:DNA replication protein DnaC
MNENVMFEQLRALRLVGFIEGVQEQRTSTRYTELPFEERLSLLVGKECLRRDNQRLNTRLKKACIRQSAASLDAVDIRTERGITKHRLLELGTCQWVKDRTSLIVTGPTGAGKSFIASALADQACRLGLSALYMRASDLIAELLLAKTDGSFRTLRKRLRKVDLLVVDDFLRDPLESAHAREFLDLIDDRFRASSCIFVSQLPVSDWHRHIVDPTIADAILDRIVHDSIRVDLAGESMRKRTSSVTAALPSASQERHVASLRRPSEKFIEKGGNS